MSKEDPPACQCREEAKGAGCNLQSLCHLFMPQCGVPVCACEDNKGEKQPKKDGHEDEICPEGADEVYEAQEAHKEEEEACMITSQYESRDSNAGAVLPKLA